MDSKKIRAELAEISIAYRDYENALKNSFQIPSKRMRLENVMINYASDIVSALIEVVSPKEDYDLIRSMEEQLSALENELAEKNALLDKMAVAEKEQVVSEDKPVKNTKPHRGAKPNGGR